MISDARLTFKRPAKLGSDAALALEDYARASSASEASVVVDATDQVVALAFQTPPRDLTDAMADDIERFFDSLASDAADRLGWS
ncbi:MAG: hypothetical protein ABI672_13975 [Vicinamibacteria bacterium]